MQNNWEPISCPNPPAASWCLQDRAASDSMDEACSLMRLNPLMRTAIRLVKGLQIRCVRACLTRNLQLAGRRLPGHFAKCMLTPCPGPDSMSLVPALLFCLASSNGLHLMKVATASPLRRQGKGEFEWSLLSGLLWFKVTERYPLSGEERSWKRRDMRRGTHHALSGLAINVLGRS